MTADLRRACERSLHVITADGGTERAGRAVLVILVSLGWPVGWAARRPLVWGVEAAYWLVARNRSRLSRFVSS
jgi:predicted DCC family thiol-disulfide oxidoreductase YuxK